ncbi:MAG: hypothetical protein ACYC2P_12725 [Paludibacteraceae bacterium]
MESKMFKKLTMLAGMFLVANLNAGEPHLKIVQKEVDRDGKKYIQTDRDLFLDNGKIWSMTLNEKGKKETFKKKYGDYFLGLDFGRPADTNGSWGKWDFFQFHVMIDGKYQNVLERFVPENVYVTKFNDATFAEFIWPLSTDDSVGKISMRIMQFPSHKDWIFVKVKFDSNNLTPWRLSFSAYPGNSNNPKERERWLGTKENHYCLSKEKTSFIPASNGLVLYSKFVHEDCGNFLIFDSAEFSKIDVPQAGAGIDVQFFPKSEKVEFKFALGYFMNKPSSDELPRFLGETQDSIYQFMEKIEWDPKINSAEFDRLVVETEKILKDMGSDTKKFQIELSKIKADFFKAQAERNLNAANMAVTALAKLKEQASQAGLSLLQ